VKHWLMLKIATFLDLIEELLDLAKRRSAR